MKRNISVNIFGTLYPIDEDAYELLLKYNENMRRYYSRMEDGDEIADDIEHRVAELMSELRSQGVMAITIEHVKQIIDRIGDPQDLDDNGTDGNSQQGEQTASQQSTNTTNNNGTTGSGSTDGPRAGVYTGEESERQEPSRRLFRDPDDRLVGGVMSGLSHYFGIKDPLLLRIVMILLLIVSLTTFGLIYIAAWLLIPEAVTPEDRLRMYGKPVTAKAINEELVKGINNANQFVRNPQHRDTARGCLSVLVKIILFFIGILCVIILGSFLISLIAAVAGLSAAALFGGIGLSAIGFEQPYFINLFSSLPIPLVITCIICALIVIGLPLYAIIRMLLKRKDTDSNMPTSVKVALILTWTVSIGILAGCLGRSFWFLQKQMNKMEKEENTHNGIYLHSSSWELLRDKGWNLETLEGTEAWLTAYGIMPNGEDGQYIKLKKSHDTDKMDYQLSQEQMMRPGTYKIDGYVKADGEGNALYVITNGMADTLRIDIPTYKEPTNPITSSDSVAIDSNDGSRHWTHVEGTFVVKQQEDVKFGVSNLREFNNAPRNGQSISIADVRVGMN